MNRNMVLDQIFKEKIIAIVRGVDPDVCEKVADALYAGGIRLLEITYDQNAPSSWSSTAHSIEMLVKKYEGRMYIGAGTVTKPELVELTEKSGGLYIISPNTNIEVIRKTKELNLVSIPGAMTPTEVLAAYDAGADMVKLFPASCLGIQYLKAIRAPLNHVSLVATGGIGKANAKDFLNAGAAGLGVGGSLTDKTAIAAGAFDKLTLAASELIASIREG